MDNKIYTHHYFLTAGETNAEGRMPLTLLMERVIEIATEHANVLGIGYARLIEEDMGWVLSKVSIEMERYPAINENYTLTTWIEGYNRLFSERNIKVSDGSGRAIGYVRTVWVAMSFSRRCLADLSVFGPLSFPAGTMECPIANTPRIGSPGADCESEYYTFRYCDVDFNRHVNTVRYIEMILNHWPLEWYDTHRVERFDIIFHRECLYDERVKLVVGPVDEQERQLCEIVRADGSRAVAVAVKWV